MVERRPALTVLTHLVLILGVSIVAFPVYVTLVASTHTAQAIVQLPRPGVYQHTASSAPSPAPRAPRSRSCGFMR